MAILRIDRRALHNSGMKNLSDFIRAMIFVGVIVKFSDDDHKQLLRDFSAMSNNINQIARRANTTGKVYPEPEDIAQIKEGQQKRKKDVLE